MYKKNDPIIRKCTPREFWMWFQLEIIQSRKRFSSPDEGIFLLDIPLPSGGLDDARVEITTKGNYSMPPGLTPPPSYTGPAAQVEYFHNEILPKIEKVVINFSFVKVDAEQFEITSQVSGPETIVDYYENDLLRKIKDKWPEQPEHAQLKIKGQSSRLKQKIEERKKRVHHWRAQGMTISEIAEREDMSEVQIKRDLGLRK
ncbi:MAG: hypothetical protein JW929_08990 [Anaerolineales bacterium]|nr:hypothetical protein [Anaerolineales bacterium]